MNRPYEGRKTRADERKIKCDSLSPEQRLEKLDIRFGKDKGAQKERARLLSQINKGTEKNKHHQINNV